MEKIMELCPNCDGKTRLRKIEKNTRFRGEDINYEVEAYVCKKCNLEIATIEQAAATQNAISDAYRKKVGLLTGQEIREKREDLGFSQKELANRAGVGIASVKRWENGIIQTKPMNTALKAAFRDVRVGNLYTGNRELSIPRIKLVIMEFARLLGHNFLEKGDKFLFVAKYLWYADFVAYHKLGKGLTGATYAALPWGPQLNNYKDLIDLIREADESTTEPLDDEERKIVNRVALTFPIKHLVINAAHRERVFLNKKVGTTIPYSGASKLTEISLD